MNTNGQALSNTNAAGHTNANARNAQANAQGGIASAGTLALNAGALDNSEGFIGSKKALNATTGAVTNTDGGTILGQSTVAIDTQGASYDNTRGQTLAIGDLSVDAGSVNTTGGLLRSGGTTTINAATVDNSATSGPDQGIEGRNVGITAVDVKNRAGAVRADANATLIASGTVDNSAGGLISARDTLAIVDPHGAKPADAAAKTLKVVNTGGTLAADKRLQLDAARFSGDGTLSASQDLSIALTQDVVNNAALSANGNLTYTTTGTFTNNSQLLAGNTLTVAGRTVDNNANAEMSGTDTAISAATLNNRGLIDSRGETRIDARAGAGAGVVNNVGTGRIYGDRISIAAGTLNNDAETVAGITNAGTIAARSRLDIAADSINNREHALIFSGG
ncbi:filamentous hemagglutinin, partial [Variovorax humicola]